MNEMDPWTPVDLPDVNSLYETFTWQAPDATNFDKGDFAAVVDAVVAHLEARHPKGDSGLWIDRYNDAMGGVRSLSKELRDVARERDEAIRDRDAWKRECEERTGHLGTVVGERDAMADQIAKMEREPDRVGGWTDFSYDLDDDFRVDVNGPTISIGTRRLAMKFSREEAIDLVRAVLSAIERTPTEEARP